MEWYAVVGIPSIISGIVALIINRGMKKRDQRQAEIQEQNRLMEQQNQAIMKGVQAILRDRLEQGYQQHLQKGWADSRDRDNLENIYRQYHTLGVNGVMDDMRKSFRSLPFYEGGPNTIVNDD